MNTSQSVETLAHSIGIDIEEIAERLAFLEFDTSDTHRLQALETPLQEAWSSHADAFYTHLLNFHDTRTQLSDPPVLARLRQSRSADFQHLLAGPPDWHYDRTASMWASCISELDWLLSGISASTTSI